MTFVFHHEFQIGLINRNVLWKNNLSGKLALKQVISRSVFIVDILLKFKFYIYYYIII